MKVSFDLRFARRSGGAGVYAAHLFQELVGQYPQVQWRVYYHPQSVLQEELLQRVQELTPEVRLERRGVRCGCLSLSQHFEFLRFRDDADLYHYPHFDVPVGMRGVPLVLTLHDLYPITVAGYCSGAKQAYFRHLSRHNARRAAAVITISQASKNDIVAHLRIPEAKITIIPQGRSLAYRPLNDRDLLDRTVQKYHLPKRFIFYTGNHKPHKNLHRLFQAYARLRRSLRDEFALILTGPISGDTQKLRALAEQLDITSRVRFLGLVPEEDLPALYNLAGLTVLPSLYEGFGLVPLEAMACGTPVVCSHAPALPEVVGQAARLFDPRSVDDITAGLELALEKDIDNPHVRQGCLQQAGQFSWQITARKTFQLYQSFWSG